MEKRLKQQIAIIPGAGRGIGRATAEKFITEGAIVILAEFDEKSGQDSADALGDNAHFIQVDVSQESSVKAMFASIKKQFGRVDILVNNAGILMDSTLAKMELEQFEKVINVNLKGVYLCTRFAAKLMKEQQSGVILNASSVVAHYGNFGQTNYVATKTGVIGMTKVWARELAKDGIRVNAVAPGFIKTEMTAGMPEKIISMMGEKVPLKRWGESVDIANAYCFLASDEASYINGHTLNVDGGVVV